MTQQELELPKGWAEATIDKMIAQDGLFKDGDWVETKDQDSNGKIRLTQLADIKKYEFKIKSNRFMNQQKVKKLNCTLLEKNDILIARMPDPLGRACIFPGNELPCATVVDVAIIRTGNGGVCSDWLMWIINSPQIHSIIEKLQSGSTRKRISRKNLGKIRFQIPPLNEQKRIASKLEELFSKIYSTKQSLEHTKLQLEQYRFSLLKSLFEGKEWKKIKIGDHLNFQYGKGLPKKDRKQGNIPVYGSSGIAGYHNKALVKTPSLIVGRKGLQVVFIWLISHFGLLIPHISLKKPKFTILNFCIIY